MKKKYSVKKTLGVKGSFVIDFISAYAVYKEPELIKFVLWPLIVFYGALFGIKMANMLKAKLAEEEEK